VRELLSRLASIGALATTVATLMVWPANADDVKRLTAAEAMELVMWGEQPIGGSFSLIDHDGARRTQADFTGKVVLVYFGFTFCPDICPADLMAIGGALNSLGDGSVKVQGLFVSLDPERDAPHLREYVTTFHPSLIGLVGTQDEIERTARDYSIYFQKIDGGAPDAYTIDHSAYTFLYDQEGTYRGYFPPGSTSDQIAEAVGRLIAD
jgi:cytochrome oxidase Cu insertion factor (SCO1/SenC/PrrC family)